MHIVMRGMALVLVLLTLACGAWAQQAQTPDDGAYMEQSPAGSINWDSGAITAKGIGAPPAGAVNPAQARGMAKRAATVVARRNLLELLRGVQIDSSTTVQNFMIADDVVVSRIQGFLQNSHIIDTAYMSDGSVEVVVGIGMRGGLADTVLPPASRFNPQVPFQGLTQAPPPPPAAPAPAAPSAAPAPATDENPAPQAAPAAVLPYTGIIVDARGLAVRPALSPRLLDEDGRELYGTASVGREYAIKLGMAGYVKDPDQAGRNPRVAGNPYVVAAVAASGASRTDLVISNAKAAELRAMADAKRIFGQARVMIVLD